MNLSNFKLKIGSKEFHGVFALVLSIIILIPVIAIVGALLSVVFSIVGMVLSFTLAVIAIGAVIALIYHFLPEKIKSKLGFSFNFTRTGTKEPKANQTSDGHPIIDVNFKEDK